jgi:hypothetical protein
MMRSMASWCWNMHTYIHKSGHGAGVFICFLCSCAYSSTSIWVLIGKHDRPNAPGIWDHGIPSRLECGHSQVHLGFSTWEETIKGYLGIWLTRQGDLIGFNDQSLWFNGGLTIRCFFWWFTHRFHQTWQLRNHTCVIFNCSVWLQEGPCDVNCDLYNIYIYMYISNRVWIPTYIYNINMVMHIRYYHCIRGCKSKNTIE